MTAAPIFFNGPTHSDDDASWTPARAALIDTGSLQPTAEALDWQRRADAWAQLADEESEQAVKPLPSLSRPRARPRCQSRVWTGMASMPRGAQRSLT